MSKQWEVELPITGYVAIAVEAETKEAAIKAALEKGASVDDIIEWDAVQEITRGNYFMGMRNEAVAILIEDEADE